jgi:hypothetical protein
LADMEEQCDVLDCYKDLHIDNSGRLVKMCDGCNLNSKTKITTKLVVPDGLVE